MSDTADTAGQAQPGAGTYLYALVESGLRNGLEEAQVTPMTLRAWLIETRAGGATYVNMAEQLRALSGQHVTHETIRRWLERINQDAA